MWFEEDPLFDPKATDHPENEKKIPKNLHSKHPWPQGQWSKNRIIHQCLHDTRNTSRSQLYQNTPKRSIYDTAWPFFATTSRGKRCSIAIIFSLKMAQNWNSGGSTIIRGGTTVGNTTRLMSMDIEKKKIVKIEMKSKLKHKCISLLTSCHPTSGYSDTEANRFNNQVNHMISMIPKSSMSQTWKT